MNPIHAFFAALLTFFLAGAVRRTLGVILLGATVFTAPAFCQVGAAAIVAAAARIVDVIVNVMGPLVSGVVAAARAVLGLINAFRSLFEEKVYPVQSIDRARALAAILAATFRGLFSRLLNLPVHSATLPRPAALEVLIRNRSTADFAALDAAFERVYQPVPAATLLHSSDRDLVDMDDAAAKALLKTLKESEQVVDQASGAAQDIETETQLQAPGSAAYLSGIGLTAAVQSQAMMMRMIAAELRQEAAKLAHDNARRKRNAVFSEEFRRTGAQAFGRQR